MIKIFLICFNNRNESYDELVIHDFFINLKGTKDWWHYLPNTYILATEEDSRGITDMVRNRFPVLQFLIVKIDVNDTNGLLDKTAWEWLNKYNSKSLKLKIVNRPTNVNGFRLNEIKRRAEEIQRLDNLLK